MTGKLHRMADGKDITVPTPVPTVVEALERLLTLARDGQIVGVAFAYIDLADFANASWAGDVETGAKMAGAISLLQHRYLRQWDTIE